MSTLEHPVMKQVASMLLDFIVLTFVFLGTCMVQQVSAEEAPKNCRLPDYKFENKLYKINCTNNVHNGCEILIEELKQLDEAKKRALQRERERVEQELRSGVKI